MTDFIHPYGIVPENMEWTRVRNQSESLNPYTNSGPVNDRGGDLWGLTADYSPLVGQDADLFYPWLDQIGKAGNRALIPAFHSRMDGTESAAAAFAQMQSPWRDVGAANWITTNLLETPRVVDRCLEIYCGATAPGYIYRDFTVVIGAFYQVTVDIPEQAGANVRLTIFSGATALVSTLANAVYGRRTHVVVPTTTTLRVFLYAGNDTDAFAVAYYGDLTVSRIMVVQTSVPAGAAQLVTLGGLNGALSNFRAGQFVNVQTSAGYELKRIGRTVRQIGGNTINGVNVNHVGRMPIEPPLRASVGQHAALIHHNPVCRMRLAQGPIGSRISSPLQHGFRLQFLEDPTP